MKTNLTNFKIVFTVYSEFLNIKRLFKQEGEEILNGLRIYFLNIVKM